MGKNKRGSGSSRKPSGSSGVGGAGSFALGLALGAKPAIKKTHAMSMLATDQPAETNSAARKRLRGARAAPPAVDGAPPLETSSARAGKKQRPANPDYDDAYRNLLERTQGQARSQAFHRQDAQKRRAQGKTRDGLIAPPTFVNIGGAPAVAAAALAGAPTSSVGEFVKSLCAGLEDGQGEEEAGQKEEKGRTRRSGPGGKEDMDDDEVVASGPKKHNPFAALGSDDEEDEEAQSPGVIFLPSVLSSQSQALDKANTGAVEEAPTTQGEGEDSGNGGGQENADALNSLSSMAVLSSSLLDMDTLQQPLSSIDKHEEEERGNDDSSTSTASETLPPLPIFVPLPVTATEPKGNVGGDSAKATPVVGAVAVGEVSTDAKKEAGDFDDL